MNFLLYSGAQHWTRKDAAELTSFPREMWFNRSRTTESNLTDLSKKDEKEEEEKRKSNEAFKKKLPKDSETSNILVGEVNIRGEL